VYPPEPDSTPVSSEDFDQESDALESGSGKEEEIDYDELDKMLEAGDELELEEVPEVAEEEHTLAGVGDIDFSELEKALDMDESLKAFKTGESREKENKPEEEVLDLNELDMALGMDEDLELKDAPRFMEEKSASKETEDLGLSESEKTLDLDESPESGKEDFDFAELEKELEIDEKTEPEEVAELMEEEPVLEDTALFGPEKAHDTDEPPQGKKAQETEELVFNELDKMFGSDDEQAGKMDAPRKAGGGDLPGGEDLDFSDMGKLLDTDKEPPAEAVLVKADKEPGFFDTEDIDFSDLEKMLETGEIKLDEMGLEKKNFKTGPGDDEAFDLADLETAIDKSGDDGIEELEEEPEELNLDFEPEQDEILSKIEDVEELDFSDLEDTAVSGEAAQPSEKQEMEAEELVFDFEPETESVGKQGESEETVDLDLSDLDKIISAADEPEEEISLKKEAEELELNLDLEAASGETPAGEEPGQAYQETQELDFSDLENILEGEKQDEKAEGHADEVAELDFSDIDKMLEMEGTIREQEKESDSEGFELQFGADDSSGGQQDDKFTGTLVSDEMGLQISSEDSEQEDVLKHLEGFEIDKFQGTKVIGDKTVPVSVAEEENKDKKEIKKAKKPLKSTKPSGIFIIILGIIAALLLGAGAFVVYNPFDIEIPFVSDFLGSKADEKGNLKITPVDASIKGDYVDSKSGTLFIISGNVRNDYKHPRSYIRVIGKLYTKGKKLSKTEAVFCGNIVSEKDLSNREPAVLKKHLQNRVGDKKSNMKVKPGGSIPFMIIYENPALDLDEFIVEAESSMKE